jgi:hypothetical protein
MDENAVTVTPFTEAVMEMHARLCNLIGEMPGWNDDSIDALSDAGYWRFFAFAQWTFANQPENAEGEIKAAFMEAVFKETTPAGDDEEMPDESA